MPWSNFTIFDQTDLVVFSQEYDKWQQKVDKLKTKERTGANIVKLATVGVTGMNSD